jgi:hypothetical protein
MSCGGRNLKSSFPSDGPASIPGMLSNLARSTAALSPFSFCWLLNRKWNFWPPAVLHLQGLLDKEEVDA